MLVLHSSSRCDVCLSEYSWDSSAKRPHAIACGHIFCRDCLYSNTPPLCPLCRHLYQPNKMKRLHVDKPEDIDDHKEIDLLQRLVISWDTPPDQLKEVVNEVDLWLRHRSDDACVALRKARAALERTKDLKDAASHLAETVHKLEDELTGLHDIARQQTTSRATTSQYAKQIESMTSEIYALRYQLDHFKALSYTYPYSQNPLPAPPQPLSTPNLPSFEQALSESGLGSRVLELPVSPSTSYPFEAEPRRGHRSKKRPTNSTERRHTYDDARQSFQSVSSPLASTSHYVQPHISAVTHYEQPPPRQSSHEAYRADAANDRLDVYALTEASLREYSTGFVSGVEAAIGRRRQEPTSQPSSHARPSYTSSRHAASQSFSVLEPADSYRPPSRNVYQHQPYSAPVVRDPSPPPPPPRRQSTAASSILSSASSHAGDRSSRSRSRSRSAHVPHDLQPPTNSLQALASILSADVVETSSSLSRRSNGITTVSPHSSRGQVSSAFVDPPLPSTSLNDSTSSAPNNYPNSPSTTYSRRTRNTVSSWGTNTASHLTSGSLISDLHFFRPGVPIDYEIGTGVHEFAPLNSDGESIRTRHSITSDIGFEGLTSAVSQSPPRNINSMTGILPEEIENFHSLDLNRHAPESVDARSSRHGSQNGWDANGYTSRSNRNSGHEQDSDRSSQHAEHRSTVSSRSYHERHEEFLRASVRPSTPPGPVSYYTISWDTWPSNPNINESSLFANDVPAEVEHHSSSSGEGTRRRRSGRPARSTLLLPEESPVSGGDIDYSTGYRPYGPATTLVGHSHPSPGAPASFAGNALGLELEVGPTSINAPIPTVPQSFLRTWSHDH